MSKKNILIILILVLIYYIFNKNNQTEIEKEENKENEINEKENIVNELSNDNKIIVDDKTSKILTESFSNHYYGSLETFLDTIFGRINILLYDKIVPKTVKNFWEFSRGVDINGKHYQYNQSSFHRVIKDFMIQGGDVISNDGTGSISCYGESFDDEQEGLKFKHDKPFLLSMANAGKDTNGSQFFITTKAAPWLDGKHVIFGEVIDEESKDVVRKIENVAVLYHNNKPIEDVEILSSGEYKELPPENIKSIESNCKSKIIKGKGKGKGKG
tara:strand:- start:362 stop:1174 length:813 start_codon:yes stop_codon:yes gene_type:complete